MKLFAWGRHCGRQTADLLENTFFTFSLPHTIEIKDRGLGVLQVLCFLAIAIYIFAYQIMLNNQYLKLYPVTGVIAFQLQQMRHLIGQTGFDPHSQCVSIYDNCVNMVQPRSSLPYCCNSSCTFNFSSNPDRCSCPWAPPGQVTLNCVVDDVYAVGNTRVPERIFLASFRKNTLQLYNATCDVADLCGKPWVLAQTQQVYVAGIEDYVLRMDHSLMQESLGVAISANDMNGAIYLDGTSPRHDALCANPPAGIAYAVHPDVSGKTTSSAPCLIPPDLTLAGVQGLKSPGNNTDAYYVRTLLAAAGHDLDDGNVRYNGVSLAITIVYGNIYGQLEGTGPPQFGSRKPFYYYSVRGAFDAGYQEISVNYINKTARMLESPYGISFTVKGSGSFGKPDFLTATQVVVTGMAMTALATVVVGLAARFICAKRRYYKRLLKAAAFDIDDSEDGLLWQMSNKELVEHLKQRNLPCTEDRTMKIMRLHQARHHERQIGQAIDKGVCMECSEEMERFECQDADKRCFRPECSLPWPDLKCSFGCEYYMHADCSKVCREHGRRLTNAIILDNTCSRCDKGKTTVAACPSCDFALCGKCWQACPCHEEPLTWTEKQAHKCVLCEKEGTVLSCSMSETSKYHLCMSCGPQPEVCPCHRLPLVGDLQRGLHAACSRLECSNVGSTVASCAYGDPFHLCDMCAPFTQAEEMEQRVRKFYVELEEALLKAAAEEESMATQRQAFAIEVVTLSDTRAPEDAPPQTFSEALCRGVEAVAAQAAEAVTPRGRVEALIPHGPHGPTPVVGL